MTTQEIVESVVKSELSDIQTRRIFPGIYDDFLEIDELANGEDAILKALQNAIYTFFNNRNLQTLTPAACAQFEAHLNIPPADSLDGRRQAIMDAVNARFVFNDAALAAKIAAMADGKPVKFKVDPVALTLKLWLEGDEENGTFLASDITQALRPIIPQNLQTITDSTTATAAAVFINHGLTTAIETAPPFVETARVDAETFDFWLLDAGGAKVQVIRLVRAEYTLGIKDAKDLIDSAPVILKNYTAAELPTAWDFAWRLDDLGTGVDTSIVPKY